MKLYSRRETSVILPGCHDADHALLGQDYGESSCAVQYY